MDQFFNLKILLVYKDFGADGNLSTRVFLGCRHVAIFDDHICFETYDPHIDDVRHNTINTDKVAAMRIFPLE